MEVGIQCDLEVGDINEDEGEEAQEEVATPVPKSVEMRLLRLVLGYRSIPKLEISTYDGSLTTKTLIDWISELNKYFENEEIDEEKKVKFAITRLKGRVTLWWEGVQIDRRNKNKPVIKNWDRMVAKMIGRLLPKYHHLTLYR